MLVLQLTPKNEMKRKETDRDIRDGFSISWHGLKLRPNGGFYDDLHNWL